MHITRTPHLITAAVAVVALSAGLGSAAVAAAPAVHRTASTPTTTLTTQYTRQSFDMSGTWRLTSVFTSRLGIPIRPGSFGGNDVYTTLVRRTDLAEPPGNEPVYMGSVYDASTRALIAGEIFVTPYVSPRGIVLTITQAGNPEGFADAYEAVYTVQSRNTVWSPLQFTGTWIDQDHNGGTTTMVRATGTIHQLPA